jgi:hypothetical protein
MIFNSVNKDVSAEMAYKVDPEPRARETIQGKARRDYPRKSKESKQTSNTTGASGNVCLPVSFADIFVRVVSIVSCCRNPLRLRVKRIGWKWYPWLYLQSPFHTLLHVRNTLTYAVLPIWLTDLSIKDACPFSFLFF